MIKIVDGIVVALSVEPSDVPIRGNVFASGDDEADRRAEEQVERDLADGNVWAWADASVVATCPGCQKNGASYLGAISALDEAWFTASGYYDDMVREAFDECRKNCSCDGSLSNETRVSS